MLPERRVICFDSPEGVVDSVCDRLPCPFDRVVDWPSLAVFAIADFKYIFDLSYLRAYCLATANIIELDGLLQVLVESGQPSPVCGSRLTIRNRIGATRQRGGQPKLLFHLLSAHGPKCL